MSKKLNLDEYALLVEKLRRSLDKGSRKLAELKHRYNVQIANEDDECETIAPYLFLDKKCSTRDEFVELSQQIADKMQTVLDEAKTYMNILNRVPMSKKKENLPPVTEINDTNASLALIPLLMENYKEMCHVHRVSSVEMTNMQSKLETISNLLNVEQSPKMQELKYQEMNPIPENVVISAEIEKLSEITRQQCKMMEQKSNEFNQLTRQLIQHNCHRTLWMEGSGIANLGNTCFMNAGLQILFHVMPLVDWLLKSSASLEANGNTVSTTTQLLRLLMSTRSFERFPVRADNFVRSFTEKAPQFLLGQQDDVHNFLSVLMEIIENEISPARPFAALFEFGLIINVTCPCNSQSTTRSWSTVVQLVLNGKTVLNELLHDYFEEETVTRMCFKCGEDRTQKKQYQFTDSPAYVMVQFLRFAPNKPRINSKIQIPELIDLTQFAQDKSQPTTYQLTAVINHIGIGRSSGHYTTIIRNPNRSWTQYDDSAVTKFDFTKLSLSQPYILLYKQEEPVEQDVANNGHITDLIADLNVMELRHKTATPFKAFVYRLFTKKEERKIKKWVLHFRGNSGRLRNGDISTLVGHIKNQFQKEITVQQLRSWIKGHVKNRKIPKSQQTKPENADRQKLRKPLSDDEKVHVRKLIREANEKAREKPRNWNLQTFDKIAVSSSKNHRFIDYVDKEDPTYPNIHALGYIKLHNTTKVLFFCTSQQNVYVHISQQLEKTCRAKGCPSWMQAIVTEKYTIDWAYNIIAVADNLNSAMRLKLATVYLMENQSYYNNRFIKFMPIRIGLDEYLTVLSRNNVQCDVNSIKEMKALNEVNEDTN